MKFLFYIEVIGAVIAGIWLLIFIGIGIRFLIGEIADKIKEKRKG